MNNTIEKNIQRIRLFSLTCTLNDNGQLRHFHNGHEFVEVGGIKWATCNVGATKPTDSGLYFAWGETKGFTAEQVRNGERHFNWSDYKYGNYNSLTKYNNTNEKTTLEPQDDTATFNIGIGWRMPTRDEFRILLDSTTYKWVTNYQGSGVNGRLFIDKKDSTKTLFFPAVGFCRSGDAPFVGFSGYYWSSSFHISDVIYGHDLLFSSDYGDIGCNSRYYGFTVRGVVDE